jgi:hypothetical protein
MDNQGTIQWVNEQRLLPEPVRHLLFSDSDTGHQAEI